MKKTINKNLMMVILIIILETVLIKWGMFRFLPSKFFYDTNGILSIMQNNFTADDSYMFAANFFNCINIFGFQTLEQWNWFFAIIFTAIIIFFIAKNKKYNLIQYLFIIASVGLLNIYVFTLSKDLIQFLFFLVIFLLLKNKNMSNFKKLLFCSIILIIESIYFRVYYVIMAILMCTIYAIYNMFIKNKDVSKKTIIKIVLLAFVLFFVEIFTLQLVSEDNYYSIMYARSSVNSDRLYNVDANTIIIELFGDNTSFIKFILNYIINSLRMMIPIELLGKGIKYTPFILYQLLISYNVLKYSKKINDKNIMVLIAVISYFMISIIFEPDFGSFIRHESSMFLVLLEMFVINYKHDEAKSVVKQE